MAMNWAILDPQSVKVEIPDYVGSISRGVSLGRNLGELAGMRALGKQVAMDAQGTELGSSIGALAAYNPEKALTMLESRNLLGSRLESAEDIAEMRRKAGIDSPEKVVISDDIAKNTTAHLDLINKAIRADRAKDDSALEAVVESAYRFEANDKMLRAKAASLGMPVGAINGFAIKKGINDVLAEMGRQDIALRMAEVQEKMLPIEMRKAEALTKTAETGAKTANVELSQAPNKIISEVAQEFNATDDGKTLGKVETALRLLDSAYSNAKAGNTSAMQTILVMANKADDPDSAVLLGEATARGDLSTANKVLNEAKSVFGTDIRVASMGPAYKQAKDSFTIRYNAGKGKLDQAISNAQKRIDAAGLKYTVTPSDFFQSSSFSFKDNGGNGGWEEVK